MPPVLGSPYACWRAAFGRPTAIYRVADRKIRFYRTNVLKRLATLMRARVGPADAAASA
jgi:hypothetical protein